jgi:hypothetical protein
MKCPRCGNDKRNWPIGQNGIRHCTCYSRGNDGLELIITEKNYKQYIKEYLENIND